MSKPKPDSEKERSGQGEWMKYAGMATQLAVSIGACALLGRYLDGRFETNPILTVSLSLLGVFGGLYIALKDFINP